MEETMIESTDDVTFVINGEKILVAVHAHMPLEKAIKRVLSVTQNILRPFEEWEITKADGSPQPIANTMCDFPTKGPMFFVKPRAPVTYAEAAQRPR